MEEQVLSFMMKELPALSVILFLAWKIANYFNKIDKQHRDELIEQHKQTEITSREKEERHQKDLREVQAQMNSLAATNLNSTMEMYANQARDNKEHYERQQQSNAENIQRLENIFKIETESNKLQIDGLRLIYEGQEARLIVVKGEFSDYKKDTEVRRKADQEIYNELLREEKKVFTNAVNAFNGALVQFEDTAKRIIKLESDVNRKIDNLEINVNNIKDIIS